MLPEKITVHEELEMHGGIVLLTSRSISWNIYLCGFFATLEVNQLE